MKTALLKTVCLLKKGKKPYVKFRLFEIKDQVLHCLVSESNLSAMAKQVVTLDEPIVLIDESEIKKLTCYNGNLQELTASEKYRFLKYKKTKR